MAAYLNKVQIMGNLGRDPEIRHTQDGKAIANVTVATTESWKDQSGQKQERTEWHRVVVFGGIAGVVEKYLKKGAPVYFEGKLQTRKWTDNSGVEKYTTEIVVDQRGTMQMLGGRGDAPSSSYDAASNSGFDQSAMPAAATAKVSADEAFDDDIPF